MATRFDYDAVILAGGRGQRMGGLDKGLVPWEGRALVDHVIDRIKVQSAVPARIMISANRHLSIYESRGPVLTDTQPGFEGPLRGVEAALRQCSTDFLLVVPCDSPKLPRNLALALFEQGAGKPAYASCASTDHPLMCLLPRDSLPALEHYLSSGQRRVKGWLSGLGAVRVPFDDPEGFLNFNSPDLLV